MSDDIAIPELRGLSLLCSMQFQHFLLQLFPKRCIPIEKVKMREGEEEEEGEMEEYK